MQNGLNSRCEVPSRIHVVAFIHIKQASATHNALEQSILYTLVQASDIGCARVRVHTTRWVFRSYQILFNGGNSNCVYNNAELFMSELQMYEWNTPLQTIPRRN